jgi:hypothetical protein
MRTERCKLPRCGRRAPRHSDTLDMGRDREEISARSPEILVTAHTQYCPWGESFLAGGHPQLVLRQQRWKSLNILMACLPLPLTKVHQVFLGAPSYITKTSAPEGERFLSDWSIDVFQLPKAVPSTWKVLAKYQRNEQVYE